MQNLDSILNFVQISETIATAGQPTEAQLIDIRNAGYQTIVNLALTTSTNALPNEQEIVEAQGMHYVHIPVVWENPTQDDLHRFFESMNENANRKVFIHCAMNMRVSVFVYLYRRIQESVPDNLAQKDLYKVWIPNETWQNFIDQMLANYENHN
jgi:protein tyrosine phosphatase (PTP) superfamily phosphohydrolase (DUF442 family)